MYIIVGLGNPEGKYTFTRHNAGFLAVEILARRLGLEGWKYGHKAQVVEGRIGSQRVAIAKPQTYMNLSGQSVVELVNWYKIDPAEELIVVYDDIDLAAGEIRVRPKGSAGTHNGMRSILYLMGTDAFPRVRIGIGPKKPEWDLANFVLANFEEAEKETVWKTLNDAADACELIVREGVSEAQKAYNKKAKKPKTEEETPENNE